MTSGRQGPKSSRPRALGFELLRRLPAALGASGAFLLLGSDGDGWGWDIKKPKMVINLIKVLGFKVSSIMGLWNTFFFGERLLFGPQEKQNTHNQSIFWLRQHFQWGDRYSKTGHAMVVEWMTEFPRQMTKWERYFLIQHCRTTLADFKEILKQFKGWYFPPKCPTCCKDLNALRYADIQSREVGLRDLNMVV